ncbi:transposase [Streptomyces scabiei]|uniref:transposase n=1 Tax=Streptomyces scabiei TaxID=1930 RepID=UPI000AB6C677|nr:MULTISPECIES: transposase [Streptomyces]MDW8474744.1 transposase [Streptomyces scabiei]MDX2566586.1 transposase [Streptomyces scabiei]MDX2625703.1 transposase [Streptomyces scabiei]MDX3152831.1 transposase [Streptomyces scabiei]MDX3158729.1 transposase [Streptomyces scabiei]
MIDDSGDRKDGSATAHMRRQRSGWLGETANGIVTVNAVPTDGRVHNPLHGTPTLPPTTSPPAGPTQPSVRSPG